MIRRSRGPLWMKEAVLVCFHMWRRFIALKIANRKGLPDPTFSVPYLPQWTKLLKTLLYYRSKKQRAALAAAELKLRQWFSRWMKVLKSPNREIPFSPDELATRHYSQVLCKKIISAWYRTIRANGKVFRKRNTYFHAWADWNARRLTMCFQSMQELCREIIGRRIASLRVLRSNMKNRKLLLCAYAINGMFEHMHMIDCWRRWAAYQRSKFRWKTMISNYRYTWYASRNKAIIAAWKLFTIESKESKQRQIESIDETQSSKPPLFSDNNSPNKQTNLTIQIPNSSSSNAQDTPFDYSVLLVDDTIQRQDSISHVIEVDDLSLGDIVRAEIDICVNSSNDAMPLLFSEATVRLFAQCVYLSHKSYQTTLIQINNEPSASIDTIDIDDVESIKYKKRLKQLATIQQNLQSAVDENSLQRAANAIVNGAIVYSRFIDQIARHVGDNYLPILSLLLANSKNYLCTRILRFDKDETLMRCQSPLAAVFIGGQIDRWIDCNLSRREALNLTNDTSIRETIGVNFATARRSTIGQLSERSYLPSHRSSISILSIPPVKKRSGVIIPLQPRIVDSWVDTVDITMLLQQYSVIINKLIEEAKSERDPQFIRDKQLLNNGFIRQARNEFLRMRKLNNPIEEETKTLKKTKLLKNGKRVETANIKGTAEVYLSLNLQLICNAIDKHKPILSNFMDRLENAGIDEIVLETWQPILPKINNKLVESMQSSMTEVFVERMIDECYLSLGRLFAFCEAMGVRLPTPTTYHAIYDVDVPNCLSVWTIDSYYQDLLVCPIKAKLWTVLPESWWDVQSVLFRLERELGFLDATIESIKLRLVAASGQLQSINEQSKVLNKYVDKVKDEVLAIGEKRRSQMKQNEFERAQVKKRRKHIISTILLYDKQILKIKEQIVQSEYMLAAGNFLGVFSAFEESLEDYLSTVIQVDTRRSFTSHETIQQAAFSIIESKKNLIPEIKEKLNDLYSQRAANDVDIACMDEFTRRSSDWLRDYGDNRLQMLLDIHEIINRTRKKQLELKAFDHKDRTLQASLSKYMSYLLDKLSYIRSDSSRIDEKHQENRLITLMARPTKAILDKPNPLLNPRVALSIKQSVREEILDNPIDVIIDSDVIRNATINSPTRKRALPTLAGTMSSFRSHLDGLLKEEKSEELELELRGKMFEEYWMVIDPQAVVRKSKDTSSRLTSPNVQRSTKSTKTFNFGSTVSNNQFQKSLNESLELLEEQRSDDDEDEEKVKLSRTRRMWNAIGDQYWKMKEEKIREMLQREKEIKMIARFTMVSDAEAEETLEKRIFERTGRQPMKDNKIVKPKLPKRKKPKIAMARAERPWLLPLGEKVWQPTENVKQAISFSVEEHPDRLNNYSKLTMMKPRTPKIQEVRTTLRVKDKDEGANKKAFVIPDPFVGLGMAEFPHTKASLLHVTGKAMPKLQIESSNSPKIKQRNSINENKQTGLTGRKLSPRTLKRRMSRSSTPIDQSKLSTPVDNIFHEKAADNAFFNESMNESQLVNEIKSVASEDHSEKSTHEKDKIIASESNSNSRLNTPMISERRRSSRLFSDTVSSSMRRRQSQSSNRLSDDESFKQNLTGLSQDSTSLEIALNTELDIKDIPFETSQQFVVTDSLPHTVTAATGRLSNHSSQPPSTTHHLSSQTIHVTVPTIPKADSQNNLQVAAKPLQLAINTHLLRSNYTSAANSVMNSPSIKPLYDLKAHPRRASASVSEIHSTLQSAIHLKDNHRHLSERITHNELNEALTRLIETTPMLDITDDLNSKEDQTDIMKNLPMSELIDFTTKRRLSAMIDGVNPFVPSSSETIDLIPKLVDLQSIRSDDEVAIIRQHSEISNESNNSDSDRSYSSSSMKSDSIDENMQELSHSLYLASLPGLKSSQSTILNNTQSLVELVQTEMVKTKSPVPSVDLNWLWNDESAKMQSTLNYQPVPPDSLLSNRSTDRLSQTLSLPDRIDLYSSSDIKIEASPSLSSNNQITNSFIDESTSNSRGFNKSDNMEVRLTPEGRIDIRLLNKSPNKSPMHYNLSNERGFTRTSSSTLSLVVENVKRLMKEREDVPLPRNAASYYITRAQTAEALRATSRRRGRTAEGIESKTITFGMISTPAIPSTVEPNDLQLQALGKSSNIPNNPIDRKHVISRSQDFTSISREKNVKLPEIMLGRGYALNRPASSITDSSDRWTGRSQSRQITSRLNLKHNVKISKQIDELSNEVIQRIGNDDTALILAYDTILKSNNITNYKNDNSQSFVDHMNYNHVETQGNNQVDNLVDKQTDKQSDVKAVDFKIVSKKSNNIIKKPKKKAKNDSTHSVESLSIMSNSLTDSINQSVLLDEVYRSDSRLNSDVLSLSDYMTRESRAIGSRGLINKSVEMELTNDLRQFVRETSASSLLRSSRTPRIGSRSMPKRRLAPLTSVRTESGAISPNIKTLSKPKMSLGNGYLIKTMSQQPSSASSASDLKRAGTPRWEHLDKDSTSDFEILKPISKLFYSKSNKAV
eukprot:gene17963-23593_t